MKIIKRGKKPEDKVYRGTCYKCDTVVEFKRSEGNISYDQRDGDFISINCPVCNDAINIDLDNGK